MHYCLTTMKRAGFRVPELAPPSCAPGRNKRATPSRRVEGPAGFDNKSLLSYRAARGGRSFRLSPPLGRGDLSKERQITSGDNIKPESFSPSPSRSAFTTHVCGGAATSSDSPHSPASGLPREPCSSHAADCRLRASGPRALRPRLTACLRPHPSPAWDSGVPWRRRATCFVR